MTRTSGPCSCGAGHAYDDCCGRLHRGEAHAATAEELMRSRYSAFALGDVAYLRQTWHPSTRPAPFTPDTDRRWSRLDVLATSGGGVFDSEGTVDFVAHYEVGGRRDVHRERSSFVRENRRWYYVAGR